MAKGNNSIELANVSRYNRFQDEAGARLPASHPPQTCPDAEAARSADIVVVSTASGRFKKGLMAVAVTGGTLLGGGLVAAVTVPLLKQQRDNALALGNNAVNALKQCQANVSALTPSANFEAWLEEQIAPKAGDWVPSDDPANNDTAARPAMLGRATCTAPEFADEPLFADISIPDFTHTAMGPLFNGGLPRVGDIGRALNGNVYFGNYGSTVLLESLAAMHPEFLAGNLRSADTAANGTRYFLNRVFNRPTPLGDPTQAWLRASATADYPVPADAAVWPLVANIARTYASHAAFADPLQAPGDANDYGDMARKAAIVISGSPIQSYPINRRTLLMDLGVLNDSTDPKAFQDKDDNIPFAVEMLRVNPMLFGSVQFNRINTQFFPQDVANLSDGTVVRRLNSLDFSIEPQGKPAWSVSYANKGISTEIDYAIVGMHADGLSLRLASDAPEAESRYLPYEAMTYAGDALVLGRIHCGERQLLIAY